MITLSQASVTAVVMYLQLPDSVFWLHPRLPFRKHRSAFFYLEGFEVVNNRNNEDKNRLLLVFQHRD